MTSVSTGRDTRTRPRTGEAYGGIVFAAMMMVLAGTLQALQGLVALVNEDFYVTRQEYLYQFDLTTWGWTHLAWGVVVGLAGLALLGGLAWARTAVVVLAALGIVMNALWLPHYPVWSVVVIAFDTFAIWAVTTHPTAGNRGA